MRTGAGGSGRIGIRGWRIEPSRDSDGGGMDGERESAKLLGTTIEDSLRGSSDGFDDAGNSPGARGDVGDGPRWIALDANGGDRMLLVLIGGGGTNFGGGSMLTDVVLGIPQPGSAAPRPTVASYVIAPVPSAGSDCAVNPPPNAVNGSGMGSDVDGTAGTDDTASDDIGGP